MHNLKIIADTASCGTEYLSVANWVLQLVQPDHQVSAECIDLANLEVECPPTRWNGPLNEKDDGKIEHWRDVINRSDAFIIILTDDHMGFPGPIRNAFNLLYKEWNYKPVSFICYGIDNRTRSTELLRKVVVPLGMMPINEVVCLPVHYNEMGEREQFIPDPKIIRSAKVMVAELIRWSNALKGVRNHLLN